MTSTSYGVVIGSVVVGLFLATHAYPAAPTDNLFLAATAGGEHQPGDDATAFGTFGFNWGLPVNHNSAADEIGVGLQVGADFTVREGDPEWSATVGPFLRRLPSVGGEQAALAVLFDYYRTTDQADVWALRPILGTTVSDQDAIGVTGVVPLRDDGCADCAERVLAFWTREWTEDLVTELEAGYQGGDVDEGVGGAYVVYALDPSWDLTLSGKINTGGHYTTGLRVSYHFGALRRHDAIHNVRSEGTGRFTPWPRRRGHVVGCRGDGLTPGPDPEPTD